MTTGILGGGLSGVTLQRFLKDDSEILEKESRAGGLCRTFEKDGFQYDIGGHILFSKNEQIMDFVKEVLAGNINYCRRENKIFIKGRFVKYPFENGLGALDKEDTYECLMGFLKNEHPKPSNFREWIYHVFGDGIANNYMVPYNEKIWKTNLTEMGLEWVERVPKPPVEDIVKSALGIETEGYVHQLYFLYPTEGGIEGFFKSVIKENARIETGYEVRKIRKKGNGWLVSDGSGDRHYDRLVLTIPVHEAVKCMEGVPQEVLDALAALRHNAVRVVLVGVNNESLMDKSAIYVPSRDVVAHRICYMGYFSKKTVPEGKSSLMAEITTHKGQELYDVSNAGLIEKTVNDLHNAGLINKQEVVTTDIQNLEYGYVVYDLDYHKNVKTVRDYFASIGIELNGRFAEYDYINMDEVVRRSVKLADKLNTAAGK